MVPAVPTALEAHERVGGPAATRQSVLVRAVIASFTQPTQIEIPIPERRRHVRRENARTRLPQVTQFKRGANSLFVGRNVQRRT
jgi:hypothetical protein